MNKTSEYMMVEYHEEIKTWFCPYCGFSLAHEKPKNYWKFCPICGQKIVWVDAEKKGMINEQ